MIELHLDRNSNAPISPPDSGFLYVEQANYVTLSPGNRRGLTRVYSDGATSCVIIAVAGILHDGSSAVSLAHLDAPPAIDYFFSIVSDTYREACHFVAQGANPPGNHCSRENALYLEACLTSYKINKKHCHLFLLEGDPRKRNRGCLGVTLLPGDKIEVSNQPVAIRPHQRDPYRGAQVVYGLVRQECPLTNLLRDALLPFGDEEIRSLVELAWDYRLDPDDPRTAFTNIVNLRDDEIKEIWSSTPEYEPPWFCEQLRQGAHFAATKARRERV